MEKRYNSSKEMLQDMIDTNEVAFMDIACNLFSAFGQILDRGGVYNGHCSIDTTEKTRTIYFKIYDSSDAVDILQTTLLQKSLDRNKDVLQ